MYTEIRDCYQFNKQLTHAVLINTGSNITDNMPNAQTDRQTDTNTHTHTHTQTQTHTHTHTHTLKFHNNNKKVQF